MHACAFETERERGGGKEEREEISAPSAHVQARICAAVEEAPETHKQRDGAAPDGSAKKAGWRWGGLEAERVEDFFFFFKLEFQEKGEFGNGFFILQITASDVSQLNRSL